MIVKEQEKLLILIIKLEIRVFFTKPVNLTVSGQLHGETCLCVGDIYTLADQHLLKILTLLGIYVNFGWLNLKCVL